MAEEDKKEGSETSDSHPFLIRVIGFLITLPIVLLLRRVVPDPDWIYNLDRLLLFAVTYVFILFFLNHLKNLVYTALIVCLLWLTYGSIWGNYGFIQIYRDYYALLISIKSKPISKETLIPQGIKFSNGNNILNAIDFDDPSVRNFALKSTLKVKNHLEDPFFSDHRTTIQSFAIFSAINGKWNYVSDPNSREYFAKASESVEHFSGDCDDHSILMAACIKSIGGTSRLVRTTNHLYPELLVGKVRDLETIDYIIKELYNLPNQLKLHYHSDKQNRLWVNLDYTGNHPGSPFMDQKILATMEVE